MRAQWRLRPGRLRETYSKHAKTFFRCDARSAGDCQVASDAGAELIPRGNDPTTLKAGDALRVILIENKKLIRDVSFILVREGKGRVAVIRPGADGIASVVAPEAGRYMLSATHLRWGDGKDAGWISDFTT